MMIVVSADETLLITGNGDVVQPTDGIAAIGSGGNYALAAAKALAAHSSLSAKEIVVEAMKIASQIDIYTNDNSVAEEL
jgi:ATP-dependent HslUV protease subunit HslV